jgi:hypothetical protein
MSTNSKTLETRPSDNFNAEFKDPDIWYSSSICNRMDQHWHTHRTSPQYEHTTYWMHTHPPAHHTCKTYYKVKLQPETEYTVGAESYPTQP